MESENRTLSGSGAEQGSQQHTGGANVVQETKDTKTMNEEPSFAPLRRYFTVVIGKTPGIHHHTIQKKLHEELHDLQEVETIEDCNFLLVFCTGPTIETARKMLPYPPDTKPAVIVVLKPDSEPSVSDSSEVMDRKNTITVKWLFQKDQSLDNTEALTRVLNWLMEKLFPEGSADSVKCDSSSQVDAKKQKSIPQSGAAQGSQQQTKGANVPEATETMDEEPSFAPLRRYFTVVIGKTPGIHHHTIQKKLHEELHDLQEVETIEDCNFLLVFCTGPTIETARKMLPYPPDTKPAVIVVLKPDSEPSVSDSSEVMDRKNTITVKWLFQKDQSLDNTEALTRVLNWLMEKRFPEGLADSVKCDSSSQVDAKKQKSIPRTDTTNTQITNTQTTNTQITNTQITNTQTAEIKTSHIIKFFTCLSGNTLNTHMDFLRRLHNRILGLTEVDTVDKSDVILVFCPIVSRAGTDISAAMGRLTSLSDTKPAVIVVLKPDSEHSVSGSRKVKDRKNTITVECVFQKDLGLLESPYNDQALTRVLNWLMGERSPEGSADSAKSRVDAKIPKPIPPVIRTSRKIKFFTCLSGNTLNAHKDFLMRLHDRIPGLTEVHTEDKSDVILVFCPIVSRAGTDISAAMGRLTSLSVTKPAVLVVLYHTFDPEFVLTDNSNWLTRGNMICVNCLFYEQNGLLSCFRNEVALNTVANFLYPEGLTLPTPKLPTPKSPTPKPPTPKLDVDVPEGEMDVDTPESKSKWLSWLPSNPSKSKTKIKFFTCVTGKPLKVHNEFVQDLQKQISDLQEVKTVDECDFILGFCTVVSTAEIDIKAALKQLMVVSDSKPAVLVVLHHTFDPECNIQDGKRYVDRVYTITAGFLFYEDQGLLKCKKNLEAFSKISQWIESQNAKKRKKIN
ncbi:uncharacterized protein LOC134303469 isoform X2 [Trichomycterus rosablanca]|uniref:uncharacterized protein LOC134303469 isoform X2 n=1 Tax=Trichomycterus rosablanca TaxID=2290929 RepID=UPI002F35E9B3